MAITSISDSHPDIHRAARESDVGWASMAED
jgi:hypothetical protein